jgi:hypothetical protein
MSCVVVILDTTNHQSINGDVTVLYSIDKQHPGYFEQENSKGHLPLQYGSRTCPLHHRRMLCYIHTKATTHNNQPHMAGERAISHLAEIVILAEEIKLDLSSFPQLWTSSDGELP